MRFSRCQRVFLRAVVAALALSVTAASAAVAKPRPGKPGGFRLFSSAQSVFTTNRVQCRIFSSGQICATGSSTVGGGIWPRGTADQYVFGSGINIAGVIAPGDRSLNGFAGDTAGAFFNNTAGGDNGQEVRPVFSSTDPADAANWPDAARVPCAVTSTSTNCAGLGGDATGDLFDPALQGGITASQGDAWFLSWEGDPARLESRTHPLGIVVETRALGWNFPSGNEDILYFVYTFYNVTSTNEADYQNVRPGLRSILLDKAKDFQALNTAKYGINLPAGGYTITNLFAAFVADMDVAQADANYASVNVPFSMGYTYEHTFSETTARSLGWTFDPAIFGSSPFFNGAGFVGVKYLRSPIDENTGQEVGLTLFGTFSRSSGSLQDPNDDKQLYRYITGGLLPTDGSCSLANPLASKICFVNLGSAADMRFFESSGPINLAPGGSGTIVVAYIFAAPVSVGGCPGVGCDVKPATSNANLTILGDPARMASGVNTIDTVTGYLGNTNADPTRVPADPDPTKVTQDEFITQPGSLLGKALIAQSVFDNKFLLPFSPERPEFFLVPGNNQVTVLWAASPSETKPDPFFVVASEPSVNGSPNPLYDPNFRDIDIEGYRIYRGRTSNPSELQLVAQFDRSGTVFHDFRGTVNPTSGCAPELGVNNKSGCSVVLSIPAPGQPYTVSRDFDVSGVITQVVPGNRVLLADSTAQILPGKLDTAFTDITKGRVAQGVSTALTNTGIPYLFVDRNVRNSLRYFYAVTAFDVNSLASGPSSLESARATKAVTPTPAASNNLIASSLVTHVIGRGVAMDTIIKSAPTIDGATGQFSGPAQPSDGGIVEFVGEFAQSVIQPNQSGEVSMTLDSMTIGQGDSEAGFGVGSAGFPATYYVTLVSPDGTSKLTVPIQQTSVGFGTPKVEADTSLFTAITVDPSVASKFEGSPPFKLFAQAVLQTPNAGLNGGWGVGCRGGDMGTPCQYNGSRWFDGPSPLKNEVTPDPTGGNCAPNAGASTALLSATSCNLTVFNNAGALTGVTVIQQALEYIHFNGQWRNFAWLGSTVHRAADYNVYWNDGGVVDSVIDVTHNVPVAFSPKLGDSWGILNNTANLAGGFDTRPAVLTMTDIGCVEPIKSEFSPGADQRVPCGGATAVMENTAVLSDIALFKDTPANAKTAAQSGQGFVMWVVGDLFMLQMPTLPTKGTVWALRTYSGAITGGKGPGGGNTNLPYKFTKAVSPFTAVGATVAVQFSVTNSVEAATKNDLSRVHTVPDPYYVQSKYEASTEQKILKFVGLPQDAIVRIYSASGVLVRMLEHHGGQYSSRSSSQGSELDWDLRNRNNQVVASGVYFYHVEAGDARRVGRFTVVNFAQ